MSTRFFLAFPAALIFTGLPGPRAAAGQPEIDGISVSLPQTGETALHILSPDTLELVLINSQPPGGPVDSWNFVSGGQFQLPTGAALQVDVGGNAVAVTDTGFRRRPLYAPLAARDLRIDNRLYLKLATPVPPGATVTVTNPDGLLWPATTVYSTDADAMRFSQAIHVNQEGYTAADPKHAMIGASLGSLGELPLSTGTAFSIVDTATGLAAYSGTLSARLDIGFTLLPTPYQQVLQADFSALTTPGEYRLTVPGLGASVPFLIDDGIAMSFARLYALGVYQQRCGSAVSLPWARHTHAPCHTAPASVPVPQASFSITWQNIASATSNALSNPRHTAPRLESAATQLYPFLRSGTVDVSGGHHDAGDYSKYTIDSALFLHSLTFAADSLPGAGALDNLGIPESGDGLSDLLQEAKIEADFLVKLQDTDGGFSFLVYPKDRKYEDNVLPENGDPQVIWPKNTSATAAAVAALAELASSPRFQSEHPAAAAAYLASAQAGWQFLLTAIATHGKDGSYQKLTHYGDVFMHDDELAWAACAMYLATGDPDCHTKLIAWYDPSSRDTRRWSWWRLFEGYGCAARDYAFAVSSGRVAASALDANYLAKCEAEVIAGADDALARSAQCAYGTAFDSESKRFRSAGWYFSTDRAFDIAVGLQLAARPDGIAAIVSNLNFEAGCNPGNVNYITGTGLRRQHEIVHQYAQNDLRILPPSGIPLGNLQSGFPWVAPYTNELGSLTFPSDGASTAPYPFYDRWGDTFNTSTEFVIVNQGRSLATLAWLAARTPLATQAWAGAVGQISLPSNWLPTGDPVTATLSVPGLSLTDARVLWETGEGMEMTDAAWTFTPANTGVQWLEAEAALPDGRRVSAATAFSTYTATGDAPWVLDADTVALYHMDGSGADSGPGGWHLNAAGNTSFPTDNTGWMSTPAGAVARFAAVGDTLSVAIPDSAIMPGSTRTPLTLEARIYPRAWKAYSVGNYPVISLNQWWDALLEVRDGKWNSPHCPIAAAGGTTIVTSAAWQNAVTLNQWQLLRLTIAADGTATCSLDGTVISTTAVPSFNAGRTNSWTLTLGNFSGDVDEVRLSKVIRP